MRKIIAALVLGATLVLGGCTTAGNIFTTVENAYGTVAGTKVNSKTAFVAISAFNGAESLVTAYLNLPQCGAIGVSKLCRANGAAEALDQPFNAGIIARNNLRAYMRANKGTLADAGLYNTLVTATASLKQIMAVYGIGG